MLFFIAIPADEKFDGTFHTYALLLVHLSIDYMFIEYKIIIFQQRNRPQ